MADEARKKEWQQLGDWQVSPSHADRALVATGSALVLGEVASAHSVRCSEQNEALRSTSEIRQYRVVGYRKRVAKTSFANFKQFNIEVWRSW